MGQPWFGVKRYGIGVGPRSPAGWAAVGGWAVLVAITNGIIHALHGPPGLDGVATAAWVLALLALMAVKGDGRPWRWRSGRD